jgi:hypothetical protein
MTQSRLLGVMQPYYFPGVSHFSLYLAASDWVIFDLPPFQKKTFISRNYFASPTGSVSTISLEISDSQVGKKLFEVQPVNLARSRDHLLGNISKFRQGSSRTNLVCELVSEIFSNLSMSLVDLNEKLLISIAKYLGFETPTTRASAIAGSEKWNVSASEWAPLISSNLNFSNYLNPVGGRNFLQPDAFKVKDVNLFFHEFKGKLLPATFGEKNLSDVSILNHLLNFDSDEIHEQLKIYSISS